ncbi:MFS transporter [Deinococcus wulumuqiensis]
MMFGAFLIRVPREGWTPEGWTPPAPSTSGMVSQHSVLVDQAFRTPQFWLLFAVLFLNVTAGIGVLGQASVMVQEMFSDKVLGAGQGVTAAAAAGFVGLLSIFNMAGRFIWSSTSDRIGRKPTYMIFFALGTVLYLLVPLFGNLANLPLFIVATCSAPPTWAPFTDGCCSPGARRRLSAPRCSTAFATARSRPGCPQRRPTAP